MSCTRIVTAVVVVCLAATAVQAQTVNIKNASFELPLAGPGFPVLGPGSDWDGPGSTGNVGVWTPAAYAATPAPDLDQVTYIQFDGVTMAQTLEYGDTSAVAASSGEIWAVGFWADNRFAPNDPNAAASSIQDLLLDLVAPDDSNVYGSVIGGPQGIGLTQAAEGYNYYTTFLTVAGGLGQRDGKQMTLQVINFSPDNVGQANTDLLSMELVPEPSTVVLAFISLGGLGVIRRRR